MSCAKREYHGSRARRSLRTSVPRLGRRCSLSKSITPCSPAHNCHCMGVADGWSSSAPTQFLVLFSGCSCLMVTSMRASVSHTSPLFFFYYSLLVLFVVFRVPFFFVRLVASLQWFSACAFFFFACVFLFLGVRRLVLLLLWGSVTAIFLPCDLCGFSIRQENSNNEKGSRRPPMPLRARVFCVVVVGNRLRWGCACGASLVLAHATTASLL